MTTIAATVSTLASSPRFSSLISANQSISQPKFSTASNSPTIISSLSSPAIIKPSLISENSICHSSYSTYAHSSSILSSLSSSPETSIMKPSVVTTRSYGRFPPMQGAVAEIKLAVCKNPDSNSNRPSFKVHNLRSSYVNDKGNVVNLIREISKKDPKLYDFLMKTAKEMIKLDMDLHCITDDELQQLWWPELGDPQDFWATSLLKHSRFSLDEAITDYVSKTFELASPMINGTNDQPGLGEFLEMRGFTTGKYH
ncbi:hypothetical protein ACET3Z_027628 [Daucus carota]